MLPCGSRAVVPHRTARHAPEARRVVVGTAAAEHRHAGTGLEDEVGEAIPIRCRLVGHLPPVEVDRIGAGVREPHPLAVQILAVVTRSVRVHLHLDLGAASVADPARVRRPQATLLALCLSLQARVDVGPGIVGRVPTGDGEPAGHQLGADIDARDRVDISQRSPELIDVGAVLDQDQLGARHQSGEGLGGFRSEALVRLRGVDPDQPHGHVTIRAGHLHGVAVHHPHAAPRIRLVTRRRTRRGGRDSGRLDAGTVGPAPGHPDRADRDSHRSAAPRSPAPRPPAQRHGHTQPTASRSAT